MKNHKLFRGFVDETQRQNLLAYIATLESNNLEIKNEHISNVHNELLGNSWIWDLTKSEVSTYLSNFQSSRLVLNTNSLPNIFYNIKDNISDLLGISKEHVFLQIIKQSSGGRIKPHYDTGYPGHINYKCNIAIQSSQYDLYIDKEKLTINQSDLYCFEASLYKHWTEPFKNERIILSYAFGLKYEDLGRSENDPRCRMSQRIIKYFQS